MPRNLSAKQHYRENKERLPKKACERYQNLCKEEKEKSNNIVVKVKKVLFLEIEEVFRGFRFLKFKNSFLLGKYNKFFRVFVSYNSFVL